MSEKPSALSTIPPQPPAEGEYDLICATMGESARGRWFLDEYARRNRNTDTAQVLAAIERIEAMIRGERDQQPYQSFRGDLLDMAKAVAPTRADVAAIEPDASAAARGPDAPPTAAPASRDIFAAAERIQDVAWTMRERGLDPRICQQIESLASSILEQALAEEQAPADEGAVDQLSTDQISTDDPSTYRASADEAVEAASAPLQGGNGHDADGAHAVMLPDQEGPAAQMAEALASLPGAAVPMSEGPAPISNDAPEPAAVPVETEPQPDPALSAAVRATIPQIELEPLVVAPVAWRKTPADEPPAELEHAPIPVEPLFPEQRAEAPAVESALVIPLFRPPEAAVVFLVEYPTDDARTEAMTVTGASVLEAVPLPERLPPVAAPEASVERSAVMIADTDKEPLVPAPADTAAAPAPQSHAYSLPIAGPIPRPQAEPVAAPAAAAASAPRDPLAALRALSPEERIALFT